MVLKNVVIKSYDDNFPNDIVVDITINDVLKEQIKAIQCDVVALNAKCSIKPIAINFHLSDENVVLSKNENYELYANHLTITPNGFYLDVICDGRYDSFDSTTQEISFESLDLPRWWCYWNDIVGEVEFFDPEIHDFDEDVYVLIHADTQEEAVKKYLILTFFSKIFKLAKKERT